MAQDEVEQEVVCLLQRYIRIDTTNPDGNELAGAKFLRDVLQREGIASEIVESAPGRANLMARLPGASSDKALALVHHMDVVPADSGTWSVPPFAAELRDGYVWGRGSLDNKGVGVMQLVALMLLKRLSLAPPRPVLLLAVADEEAGGGRGARWLMDRHFEWFTNVGFVLNEGGAILTLPDGKKVYSVELAQKAPLWLRVTARGPAGHGSTPRPSVATHVLARALGRLAAYRFPSLVIPEVQAVFTARAQHMPEPARSRYMALDAALKLPAFRETFFEAPRDAALVQNTLAITMLQGSNKENVIPASASAVLDMRLLPGQEPDAVRAQVMKVMAEPSLEIETLLSWQAQTSPKDTPLFAAIRALAEKNDPNADVAGNVIGGFTDCNAFRARGIVCYGFLPLELDLAELKRIHGQDERISVEALTKATGALVQLMRSFF